LTRFTAAEKDGGIVEITDVAGARQEDILAMAIADGTMADHGR